MELIIIWLVLTIAVAIFANSRGRSGLSWFLFSVFLSPILGIIFLLVMRNIRADEEFKRHIASLSAGGSTKKSLAPREPDFGSTHAFEPDGVYSGIPYRVAGDGSIEAVMQGAPIRFRSIETFRTAMGAPR